MAISTSAMVVAVVVVVVVTRLIKMLVLFTKLPACCLLPGTCPPNLTCLHHPCKLYGNSIHAVCISRLQITFVDGKHVANGA